VATEKGTILVVEDDDDIAGLIELYLRRDGHRVARALDGEAGLEALRSHRPDLVVLDVGLPGRLDGFEVCRRIRECSQVPVMIVTARDEEIDRILGLELGADDYVIKPFSPRELAARVKAVLRRSAHPPGAREAVLRSGSLEVDTARREARVSGTVVNLTAREFDLLAFLVTNRGLALSRRQLLDGVWGPGWYGDERTVDVHIGQLRKKLGKAFELNTVWGVGYRFG
jgi:DNA-binding response OmpR family regulator